MIKTVLIIVLLALNSAALGTHKKCTELIDDYHARIEAARLEAEAQAAAEAEAETHLNAVESSGLVYLGDWTATAYCNCEICCGQWAGGNTASGVYPTTGHTVACNSLPFGTQLLIDGVVYTVEDTGYSPFGDCWVDIYFDTHEEACTYGMRSVSVYMIE